MLLDSPGMNIDLLILYCLSSGSRIFPSHRDVIISPLKDCKIEAYAWRLWPFTCSRERSAITRDLGLQRLVRRTTAVSRLLRQAKSTEDSFQQNIPRNARVKKILKKYNFQFHSRPLLNTLLF